MTSRILISSLIASAAAAHGGPVVSRRQAAALARAGFEVCLAAPSGEPSPEDRFRTQIYQTSASPGDPSAPRRHDAAGVASLRSLIAEFRPRVVYDVHGPAWAVEAASAVGVPVVSMMGDYNWFCLQSFLVDSRLRRCSGPGDGEKCFACVNRWHRFHRRIVHSTLKPAAKAGLVRLPVWDRLTEATAYLDAMRARIATFVVGDRMAYEFLVDHGIPTARIARIAQGLPSAALAPRKRMDLAGRPVRFGFVGRAHPDKGLAVLARAFDSLSREERAELWIVHKEHASYEHMRRIFPSRSRLSSDLASGRVRLFQPQQQDEVFELMAQVDIGVVPSIAFESPSLAMLEFVAQGTPVVRSESAGMQHVIQDGVNGRTFPYGDAAALASILREVIADEGAIARWRAALPRIHDDDAYARQLSEVFAALISLHWQTTTTRELAHA